MTYRSLSLRDKIAAQAYVSFMYTDSAPIIFIIKAWEKATKEERRKCRAFADIIMPDILEGNPNGT